MSNLKPSNRDAPRDPRTPLPPQPPGAGGGVVFLHGFTGSPASFRDVSATLQLRANKQTVALTLVGHGERGDERYDRDGFRREVDAVADRIRELGPGPQHFVGYSMGARIGLGVLIEHPGLLALATLIGVNPGLRDESDRHVRCLADRRWQALLLHKGVDAFAQAWEQLPMWNSQARLDAEVIRAQRAIRRGHHARGLASCLEAIGLGRQPNYRPALARVKTSVLLVAGEFDEHYRDLAASMAAEMPKARVAVVPGCGHNPVIENPGAVAELILQHDLGAIEGARQGAKERASV